jgi:uncharacterized protein (DUF1684 family)
MSPRLRIYSAVVALAAVVVAALVLIPPVIAPAGDEFETYQNAIDEWHKQRIERLTAPTGYLSLVGLYPLDEGTNRFGSGESNHLVFPDKAPKRMGTIYSTNGKLEVAVMPGVTVTHDGQPVEKMRIESDRGRDPTVLESGTFTFYVIDRGGELYLRLKDTESALRAEFDGVERYPVDPKWRIEAHFEPYTPPKQIQIPNVLGYEITEQCPGAIVFEVAGETYRLEPTLSGSGEELFVVFGDETSGLETYGGGRFVYTPLPEEDGTLVIDFNKAYNPPCAFTPYSTCPLPHEENVLSLRVEAGEKAWSRGSHP